MQAPLVNGNRDAHTAVSLRTGIGYTRSNGLAGVAIPLLIITQRATDAATMVNWLVTRLSVLALPASAAIHTAPALRDITVRMNRLIREFDVAAELGYQQIDSMHGWRTSSRWNDARLKFARR
ncbi:MAG: hypothetical protein GEU97_02260 [Actinophytocola sp.]|nr:hypothetical protein [Actinophytocola sp.]